MTLLNHTIINQELAFKRLGGEVAQPTLVATGTGSGKTEAFMYPILDYCLKIEMLKVSKPLSSTL
jgi:superfamily II DNA/RNA helicase